MKVSGQWRISKKHAAAVLALTAADLPQRQPGVELSPEFRVDGRNFPVRLER